MPNIIKVGGAGINKSTTGTYLKGRAYTTCIPNIYTDARYVWYVNKKYLAWSNVYPYSIYSSDDGKVWTQGNVTGYSSSYVSNAFYANGKYFVTNLSRNTLYYSTDAINWTVSASDLSRDVVYTNGVFFYVDKGGSKYNYIERSTDGINWSCVLTSGSTYSFDSVKVLNGKIFAMQYTGGVHYCSSDNGVTFTQMSGTVSAECYVNGFYYGCDYKSKKYYLTYSSDGITWTNTSILLSTVSSVYVFYAFNKWWTPTSNGLYYSTNGENWTLLNSDITSLSYMNGVLIGNGGEYVSTDGATWKTLSLYPSKTIVSNGTGFVGYSYSGSTYTYYYSADGTAWTQSYSGSDMAGLSVANGWYYTSCQRSKDGITWESISPIGSPSYVGELYFNTVCDSNEQYYLLYS